MSDKCSDLTKICVLAVTAHSKVSEISQEAFHYYAEINLKPLRLPKNASCFRGGNLDLICSD